MKLLPPPTLLFNFSMIFGNDISEEAWKKYLNKAGIIFFREDTHPIRRPVSELGFYISKVGLMSAEWYEKNLV